MTISPGSTLLDDSVEILVLDEVGGALVNVATYVLAAAQADARGDLALDVLGYSNMEITLEVIVVGAASNVFIAIRSSMLPNPDLSNDAQWSRMVRTPAVAATTGVDTSQALEDKIPLTSGTQPRRVITRPITGRFVSVIVWADGANCEARVYMRRKR